MSEEKFDYLRKVLLATIAHEVRSPAGVAWTALSELDARALREPELQRLLLIARRSLRRVLCVTDRLMLAAELERGPLALQIAPLVLRDLVDRMAQVASEAFGRSGVVFEIAPDDSNGPSPRSIEADERWLGAAILELIVNALRHARGRVRARLTVKDGLVTIVIEDDGRGFPEGFQFANRERFAPEGVVGGMGLSLCMVSAVATAHGGRFFGGGSTLPAQSVGVVGAAVSIEIPSTEPPHSA